MIYKHENATITTDNKLIQINTHFDTFRIYEITAPKQKERIINAYKSSIERYGTRNLANCYNDYSVNKMLAYENCRHCALLLNARYLTIVSYNCMQFSIGFEFVHPEHGNICVAHFTKGGWNYVQL